MSMTMDDSIKQWTAQTDAKTLHHQPDQPAAHQRGRPVMHAPIARKHRDQRQTQCHANQRQKRDLARQTLDHSRRGPALEPGQGQNRDQE